jgi:hypothetical protein
MHQWPVRGIKWEKGSQITMDGQGPLG